MGRRRVHDEATADALLDAAERIVDKAGITALTVRAVAEAVQTTTRAVYSAVGSKPALLGRLGARAFDLLGAAVTALPQTDDPVEDLVRAGSVAFRTFALEHPALHAIGIQLTDVPAEAQPLIASAANRALGSLHARIDRVAAADGLGGRSRSVATVQFHALCAGLAVAELQGFLTVETAGTAGAEEVWTDGLRSLIAGWRR